MSIIKEEATVVSQNQIAEGIYDMVLRAPGVCEQAMAGQFLSLYCRDGASLLPRPISICDWNREEGTLRIVYRTAGKGTREFSSWKAGDRFDLMGPLGNGFHLREEPAILIGGGIGIPPMLALARELKAHKSIVLGYRDETFLRQEFEKLGNVYISTETGSVGLRGTVLDAIRHYGIKGQVIYACGPLPMLKAVSEYAALNGIKAQISMEERMACGVGACLGCVVCSKETDPHTNVRNKRVCKDGPVFDSREVVFS